ncbi:hypothetical protein HRG_010739 [Hirsutella rhossiliensis]|uniref:Uncharacterized protein n=1 Tax=Hirsutella rhossiliensis TaxID=111463 RepID=A0A9P8MN34_9HYPO|nr:uncharacterized protein HRG_10739 [Hirsutella rhossiliensis]KAH0958044.1 hypothetical protein HRG_10739 [Hirsutella rhossiliensis]
MLFNAITFDLPQRFQNVDGLTAVDAGIRLLQFSLGGPVASMTTVIAGRLLIPVFYILVLGSSLQLIGTGLLASIPSTTDLERAQYGYQVIAPLGVGVTFGILMLGVLFTVEKRDLATATGAMIQIRVLGGAIGLAIGSNILNVYACSHLAPFLAPEKIRSIRRTSSSMSHLPADLQVVWARQVFAQGSRLQMVLGSVVTGVSLLATLLVWRRKQLVARADWR